jgi:peptidyl-prolyl cis-trans isomerase A (cyclophilin A)
MARTTVDSAVSDFFICINDQPSLDFGGQRNVDGQGFAAFGQVIRGMEIVRAIQTAPSDGQSLSPTIPITRIRRC